MNQERKTETKLVKTETKPVYEVFINRESAVKDGSLYCWVEKFWLNTSLNVRGSNLSTGYTVFPRGQCIVKFPVDNVELKPEDIAKVLEEMVNALLGPFKAFVKIEDSQESTREEDF